MSASLESPQYFQAIGIIKGKVFVEGDKYKVEVGGLTYPLYGSKRNLIRLLEKKETFLRVYPRIFFAPGDRLNVTLGFQLVAFQDELKEGDRLNIFTIKGIWQFIPQHKRPVISIYRNQRKGTWDKCRATHLPLLWKDSPISPFRFDSKKPKEEKDDSTKYFCEIEARFLPHKGFFGFSKLLSEPSTKIPYYKRPIRAKLDTSNDKNKPKCSAGTAQKSKPNQH